MGVRRLFSRGGQIFQGGKNILFVLKMPKTCYFLFKKSKNILFRPAKREGGWQVPPLALPCERPCDPTNHFSWKLPSVPTFSQGVHRWKLIAFLTKTEWKKTQTSCVRSLHFFLRRVVCYNYSMTKHLHLSLREVTISPTCLLPPYCLRKLYVPQLLSIKP